MPSDQIAAFEGALPLAALLGNDPVLGNQARDAIASQPQALLPLLEDLLTSPPGRYQARRRLAQLIGGLGPLTLQPLLDIIKDGDWHAKVMGSECFRCLRSPAAAPAVAKLLKSGDPDVMRCAIDALGYLGAADWAFRIRDVVPEDGYWHEKLAYNAAVALLRIAGLQPNDFAADEQIGRLTQFVEREERNGKNIAQTLNRAIFFDVPFDLKPVIADAISSDWLRHESKTFRVSATNILGMLRLKRTVSVLNHRLMDSNEDVSVRIGAAYALGGIGGKAAAEALLRARQAMPPQDTALRGAILWGLSAVLYEIDLDRLNPGITAELLQQQGETVSQTIYGLGILKADPQPIIAAMESVDPSVRGVASLAWARHGGQSALARLQDAEQESSNPLERVFILTALTVAGKPDSAKHLHDSLCDLPGDMPAERLRYQWQREIIHALLQDHEQGMIRAQAWADLMQIDIGRCSAELASMLPGPDTFRADPGAPLTGWRSMVENKKVFIVHGHNEAKKWELKNFLLQLGLEPVVLHEQDDLGMTIIDKFEHYAAQCVFAFILMTPDDTSSLAGSDESKWRARQNVIMELGWFMAKLGRSKVMILYKGDIEIPSDILGVIYSRFNESITEAGERIRQRLKGAGLIAG